MNACHHADRQTDRQETRRTFLRRSAPPAVWPDWACGRGCVMRNRRQRCCRRDTPPSTPRLRWASNWPDFIGHLLKSVSPRGFGNRRPLVALMLKHGETAVVLVSLDIIGISGEIPARLNNGSPKRSESPRKTCGFAPPTRIRCPVSATYASGVRFRRSTWPMCRRRSSRRQREPKRLGSGRTAAGPSACRGRQFQSHHSTWKTDAEFGRDATDATRWLDTQISPLDSITARTNRAWSHTILGPSRVLYRRQRRSPLGRIGGRESPRAEQAVPSFLQGHAGDVNPSPGKPWLGIPEQVAEAVYAGLDDAIHGAVPVGVEMLPSTAGQVELPLDIPLFKQRLQQYLDDPSKCTDGSYVDARFAADWAAAPPNGTPHARRSLRRRPP